MVYLIRLDSMQNRTSVQVTIINPNLNIDLFYHKANFTGLKEIGKHGLEIVLEGILVQKQWEPFKEEIWGVRIKSKPGTAKYRTLP